MSVHSAPSIPWRLFEKAPKALVDAARGDGAAPASIGLPELAALRTGFQEGTEERRFIDRLSARLSGMASPEAEGRRAHTEFAFQGMRGRRRQLQLGSPSALPATGLSSEVRASLQALSTAARAGEPLAPKRLEQLVADAISEGGEDGLRNLLASTRRWAEGTWPEGAAAREAADQVCRELGRAALAWRHLSETPKGRAEALGALRSASEAVKLAGGLHPDRFSMGDFLTVFPPGLGDLLDTLPKKGGAVVGLTLASLDLAAASEAELAVVVSADRRVEDAVQVLAALLLAVDAKGDELGWSPEERRHEVERRLTGGKGRLLRKELPTAGLPLRLGNAIAEGTNPVRESRLAEYVKSATWLQGPKAAERLAHLTRLAKEGKLVPVRTRPVDEGLPGGLNALLDSHGLKTQLLDLGDYLDQSKGGAGDPRLLTLLRTLRKAEDGQVLAYGRGGYGLEADINDARERKVYSLEVETCPTPEELTVFDAAPATLARFGTPDAPTLFPSREFVGEGGIADAVHELAWSLSRRRSHYWNAVMEEAAGRRLVNEVGPKTAEEVRATIDEARAATMRHGSDDPKRWVQHHAIRLELEPTHQGHTPLMRIAGVQYNHASPEGYPDGMWKKDDLARIQALDWPSPERPEDAPRAASDFLEELLTPEWREKLASRWVARDNTEAVALVRELARDAEGIEELVKLHRFTRFLKLQLSYNEYRRGWSEADLAEAARLAFDVCLDAPGVVTDDLLDQLDEVRTVDEAAALIRALGEHLGRAPRISSRE